jgi:hypothetical protein
VPHHWRASDGLIRVGAGEWSLYDRGRLVGRIQYGRIGGRPGFRGVITDGTHEQVVGYSPSLEDCCTDFWNWYVRFGRG